MSSTAAVRRLRRFGYGVFYTLPGGLRRRLVRLIVGKYIVGAVALVRDSEASGAGRLLLLRQPPGVGWSLPAGLLERGERPVQQRHVADRAQRLRDGRRDRAQPRTGAGREHQRAQVHRPPRPGWSAEEVRYGDTISYAEEARYGGTLMP